MLRTYKKGFLLVAALLVASGCDRDRNPEHETDEKSIDRKVSDNAPSDERTGEASLEAANHRWSRPTPPTISPESTTPDPSNVSSARERYRRLVPRATLNSWRRFDNLLHEGNNIVMRGPRTSEGGPYANSGRDIATTWRRYARGVRGMFVLRDSLYSQQDHPIEHDPYSPILPPNWVTAVAHAAEHGEPFEAMSLPAPEAHQEWAGIEDPEALFRDLPSSESLFEATTPEVSTLEQNAETRQRAMNARQTLQILHRDVRAMMGVVDESPRAVVELGAERIAASGRTYFGDELRRDRIIPIAVENPRPDEIEEGKGIVPPDLEVAETLRNLVLETIYRRRLADGDLAIERYDISTSAERRRAVDVLERVIPEETDSDSASTTVWLWVTGTLDDDRKLRGEKPNAYIPDFRETLREAEVDTERLRLVGKPSVDLPREDFRTTLHEELARYRDIDVPMSIFLTSATPRLREVISAPP